MINIDFKFRAVGQGAFYTGIFKHFNGKQFSFVYDCGTDSSRQYIEKEITNFVSETNNQKIDILFISHFHRDHINKIGELLNQTGGANLAILPYLTPDELVLAYIDINLSGGIDPDTLAFIQNPAGFLQERKVDKIIFIHPSDEGDSDSEDEPQEIKTDLDSPDFDFIISNTLKPNNDILENNPKVEHYYDKGNFSIVGFWEFKFFNKTRDITTLNNLCQEVQNLLSLPTFNLSDLADYITNNENTFETDFNQIYSRNFGYGQLINDTSIVIYHGAIKTRKYRKWFGRLPGWFGSGFTGTLLTGAIRFNQDSLNQIQSKWLNQKYFKKTSVFQIPHHGANNYIESTVISSYPNVKWWVINFGLGNTHKHPRQEIIDIIENHKIQGNIFPNTQINTVEYKGLYR
ncbi:MBL fold metallo-hydrolase [Flavobacterium sp. TAB 87]|uniref:MBL fold metallo-hydrolase n=1 Tax=Flavobacterium sp. TAB 87 TaxID=1729581 RepID=UPI00076CBF22|nr:MBL fold metallo-hydrolase [Flavobacterium sp. TAB 87]KVV16027.1 ribonuclease Z [Flavobacterium sp. TAB 87]